MADAAPEEGHDPHLPAEVTVLVLLAFLGSVCAGKWLQLTKITQDSWRQSNAAARARSREALRALLPGRCRSEAAGQEGSPDEAAGGEGPAWSHSQRAFAQRLLPEALSVVSAVAFFAVRPDDISSLDVSASGGLERFYLVTLPAILFFTFVENPVPWQCLKQLFPHECEGCIRAVERSVAPVLAGRIQSNGLAEKALMVGDILWMWCVSMTAMPFFCSYQTTPPRLLAADITCWDNTEHWWLLALSASGLLGIFSWCLSMVIRKCNWPADAYWHQFEGAFERVDGAGRGRGLRLEILRRRRDEHSLLLLTVMRERPGARPAWRPCLVRCTPPPKWSWLRHLTAELEKGCRRAHQWLNELNWLYHPWADDTHECLVLDRKEWPPALEAQLRGPRPSAASARDSGPGEPLLAGGVGGEGAAAAAGRDEEDPEEDVEARMRVEALDDETLDNEASEGIGWDGPCSLRISSRADAGDRPALLSQLEGDWRRTAFLKIPHAVEPHAYFAMTIVKVVATLSWSAYAPPHVSETWRACIVGVLIVCALSNAAIAYLCRPSAFDFVNTLTVIGMLGAAGVSLFSFWVASVLPPGALFVVLVSLAMRLIAVVAFFLAAVHMLCWLMRGSPLLESLQKWPWSAVKSRMDPLWAEVGEWLPVWAVHVGETAKEIRPFTEQNWRHAHKSLKDFYREDGLDLEPSQIKLDGGGPLRIVEVYAQQLGRSGPPLPLAGGPVVAPTTNDGDDRRRHRWVPYERWAQDPRSRRVLSMVQGALAPAGEEAEEAESSGVRVVREGLTSRSLFDRLHMEDGGGGPGAGRTSRLNLCQAGQRLQDVDPHVPRVLVLGVRGSGKSALLSALGGLSHSDGASRVGGVAQPRDATDDTTALLTGSRRQRLLIDMPDAGSEGRDYVQHLGNAKRKLAGSLSDDEARAVSAEDRLFINHFLLTVRATEDFSGLREPLSMVSRHLGPMMVSPGMLTVVFTDAMHAPLAEQQRRIIDTFKKELARIFPKEPELVLATSDLSHYPKSVPCVFIEAPAVMKDCRWRYTAHEQATAWQAQKLILRRIDESVHRQLPTSRWPPVLSEYKGGDLVYGPDQDLRAFLSPVFEYKGLPPGDTAFTWTLDRELGTLTVVGSGPDVGRLEGKVPTAGYYDVGVMATYRAPPDCLDCPVPLQSWLIVRLQIGHTYETLTALLGKELRKGPDGLKRLMDSDLPDVQEAAMMLRTRLGSSYGTLTADQEGKLVDKVANRAIRHWSDTNKRISSIMRMAHEHNMQRREELRSRMSLESQLAETEVVLRQELAEEHKECEAFRESSASAAEKNAMLMQELEALRESSASMEEGDAELRKQLREEQKELEALTESSAQSEAELRRELEELRQRADVSTRPSSSASGEAGAAGHRGSAP